MMTDKTLANGSQIVDAITKVHGPSHTELLRPFQKSLNQIAREHQQKSADQVLNWGRSGETQLTPEHGDVPKAGTVKTSGGVHAESAATTSTTPSLLGTELKPVSSHGGDKNWNMERIAGTPITQYRR